MYYQDSMAFLSSPCRSGDKDGLVIKSTNGQTLTCEKQIPDTGQRQDRPKGQSRIPKLDVPYRVHRLSRCIVGSARLPPGLLVGYVITLSISGSEMRAEYDILKVSHRNKMDNPSYRGGEKKSST
ncbi:hypothetical protein ACTXT7_003983 [Hymenolepis weldensis]